MSRTGNFDRLAGYYDSLARFVFGQEKVASQTHFLARIPPGASVLILGGGTGWILDELFARTIRCEVWYIDASEKMLEKARGRGRRGAVHFIHGSWEDVPAQKFDVVVTNYFLDLFSDQTLEDIVAVVGSRLDEEGIWLVTDFTDDKKWHRVMLRVMYWFFGVVCRIEASALPAWEEAMLRSGFRQAESRRGFRGFMKSVLFKR